MRPLRPAPRMSALWSEAGRRRALARVEAAFVEAAGGKDKTLGLGSAEFPDAALALQAAEAAGLLALGWERVFAALSALALKHRGLPAMARTHGIQQQPMSFAAKLAGYAAEARRNQQRLRAAQDHIAFAKLSGPSGQYAQLDPAWEAEALAALGLKPEPAAGRVVPRDRHAGYFFRLALSAAAVERLALELRSLGRTELQEAALPQDPASLPAERAPVAAEELCGLARVVRAQVAAALENVASAHEGDSTHDAFERRAFPEACQALDAMLVRLAELLEGLQLNRGKVRENLDKTRGQAFSRAVLAALAAKGLSKEAARKLLKPAAERALAEGRHLGEALRDDPAVRKRLSVPELEACFSLEPFLKWEGAILERAGILPPSS